MSNKVNIQAVTQAAMREVITKMLTEPMTAVTLAAYFSVNRNVMARMLGYMAGAERFGSLWRVPISKMPPKYFQERGLVSRA